MKVGDILLGLKVDTSGLRNQISNAGTEAGTTLTEKMTGQFSVLKGALADLAAGAISKMTSALAGGIKAGIGYTAALEQTATAFSTMTGSAAKAQQIVQELSTMAAKTPFEMTDLTKATQTLMEYGLTSKKAVSSMQMLGDISQGNAEKMQSLALAYGQMSSLGKVQLQDVKQMISAGFNPLQVVSERTGESMASLYQRISKGTMSVNEITAAMQAATSKGGAYYQSMAKQSKTLNGVISTLKENATKLMSTLLSPAVTWFANVALPYLIKAVDTLQARLNKLFGIKTNTGNGKTLGKLTGLSDGLGRSAKKTRQAISDSAKKATESVKRAAKEAKNSLAAFDEINNLTTQSKAKTGKSKGKSKGGSGSESGGDDDSDGPAAAIAKNADGPLQKAVGKVKSIIGPSFNRMKNNTKRLFDDIADSVRKVALNGTGLKTLKLMAGIINGIFGTIGNIAGALARAWEHNETGTKIVQHLWDIFNSILKVILAIVSAIEKMTRKLNLNYLLENIEYTLKYAALIIDDIADGISRMMGYIADGKFGKAGEALSDGFKKAFSDLAAYFNNFDYKKFGKTITNVIVGAFNALGDFLSHIDWGGLAVGLLNVLWSVVKSILKTIASIDWMKVLKALFSIPAKLAEEARKAIDKMKIPAPIKALLKVLTNSGIATGFTALFAFKGAAGILKTVATLQKGLLGISLAGSKIAGIFTTGFANVGTVLGGLISGVSKLAAFAAANPAVLIIAGIVAVVAALVALYRHCKVFRNFVNGLWALIKKIFSRVVGFVKRDWKEILLFLANPIAGLFAMFYKHSAKFRNVVNGMLKTVKGFFTGIFEKAVSFFSNIGKAISGFFKRIVEGAKQIAEAVKNSVVGQIVGKVFDAAGNLIGAGLSALPHFASGGYVEANTPRLAVVGDNRHEGEFVAPEGKLKAAVQQAMAEERVYNAGNNATSTGALLAVLYEILKELKEKNITIDGDKLTAMIERKKKEKGLRTG